MSKDNPISTGVHWWKEHGPSPWLTALLAGALSYGKYRAMWNPSIETLRSLGRPVGKRLMGSDRAWNREIDELKSSSSARHRLPAALGLLTAASVAGLLYRPGVEGGGLLKWDAPNKPLYSPNALETKLASLQKTASYITDSYMQDLDWAKPIDARTAQALFTNDPKVQENAYARNMGLAIVNNAVNTSGSYHPTLGNVFDSALSKIENKLSWGGATDVALKSAVSNMTARLFTGALGAVCDMNDKTRQALVDAGTWAGAITAILD
jgi:hypothetical protein